MKQSKLGIASFILSLMPILILGILILIHSLFHITTDTALYKYEALIMPRILDLAFTALLVSVIFGISGLIQKNREKNYAKFGLMFSGIQLIVIAALRIWVINQHFS